jgi:hypothetical protein
MPPRLKDAAVLAVASLSAPCSPTTEPAIGCDLALRSGAATWGCDLAGRYRFWPHARLWFNYAGGFADTNLDRLCVGSAGRPQSDGEGRSRVEQWVGPTI